MSALPVEMILNGRRIRCDVRPDQTLLELLREGQQAVEVKDGCERGDCGSCLVFLDGVLVNSCLVLAAQAYGCEVVTIKGIGDARQLHPLQEAFVAQGAVQCGFCTPGMILAAKALLDVNPDPGEREIRQAISGNYCRCTGYHKIIAAVEMAARLMREAGGAAPEDPPVRAGDS